MSLASCIGCLYAAALAAIVLVAPIFLLLSWAGLVDFKSAMRVVAVALLVWALYCCLSSP